jgi:hypothetical protein
MRLAVVGKAVVTSETSGTPTSEGVDLPTRPEQTTTLVDPERSQRLRLAPLV